MVNTLCLWWNCDEDNSNTICENIYFFDLSVIKKNYLPRVHSHLCFFSKGRMTIIKKSSKTWICFGSWYTYCVSLKNVQTARGLLWALTSKNLRNRKGQTDSTTVDKYNSSWIKKDVRCYPEFQLKMAFIENSFIWISFPVRHSTDMLCIMTQEIPNNG